MAHPAGGAGRPDHSPRSGTRFAVILAGVVVGFVVVAVAIGVMLWLGARDGDDNKQAHPQSQQAGGSSEPENIPAPSLSQAQIAELPLADTGGKVAKAPINLTSVSDGRVIEVGAAQAVGFASPGKDPITRIPHEQIGAKTWLPIIAERANWVQVRLPSRPNGATAWMPRDGRQTATTKWAVTIDLSKDRMSITSGGSTVGEWEIGKGMDDTPTPKGQTFLLAGFVDPEQSFSPVIYALGSHSDTLDTYGGGPGTVAVHGWPTRSGRIGQVSHGCVRVPQAALDAFGKLPAGTPVNIV